MAADVGGELQSSEHGAQGVEAGIVASKCVPVLLIDGLQVAGLGEYGEQVVCIGGPAVYDSLHHGFDLYLYALSGLAANVYELAACDVGLAHVCQIYECQPSRAETEYKYIACEFELVLHVVQAPAVPIAAGEQCMTYVELAELAYVGCVYGPLYGACHAAVGGAEGLAVLDNALPHGFVIDGLQGTDIEGCGVPAQAVGLQPGFVV